MKRIITRPFDRAKIPPRQNPVILFGMWIWSLFTVKGHHLKITKTDMDGLKPPYIVFCRYTAGFVPAQGKLCFGTGGL